MKPLSPEMKSTLVRILEGDNDKFNKGTLKALIIRDLVGVDKKLTLNGWKQALLNLNLTSQCEYLGINLQKIEGLEANRQPEITAYNHFIKKGYVGSFCEGGALLVLIRAAALDILAELNPFNSRQDAISRFTEAQLMIHKDHVSEIASVIENTNTESIARNFHEIYSTQITRETYPGLTEYFMISFFNVLGSTQLRKLTVAIAEAPYLYRKGWPDLTLVKGKSLIWAEIKVKDKLHLSQINTLHRMKQLMYGKIRVLQLC